MENIKNFDNNQRFCIAIFTKDNKFYYFKNLKPIEIEKYNYEKTETIISLYFDLPGIDFYGINATITEIENNLPDNANQCKYIISKEDNEQKLKDILIKYCINRLIEFENHCKQELKKINKNKQFFEKLLNCK